MKPKKYPVLTRRLALAACTAFSLFTHTRAHADAAPQQPRKPDIIVVVFDDLGFSDFGAYGSEIHTPVIDRIASEGVRYNHFDTKAICSATRAAFLTGRNNQTVGMAALPARTETPTPEEAGKNRGALAENAETLPQALKTAGYITLALGKWHLSPAWEGGPATKGPIGTITESTPRTSWPLQKGFDSYYGFLGGWSDQYHPALIANNQPVHPRLPENYHLSADLVDHAISSLQTSHQQAPDKPVFLYLALGTVHAPLQVPELYRARYKGAYDKGWDQLRQERFERQKKLGLIPQTTVLPPRDAADIAWDALSPQSQMVFSRFMETYAGYIEHADTQLGRLIQYLKASGRYENTVLMIFSDNGAAGEGGQKGGFYRPYADPTPVAEMAQALDALGTDKTKALYQRPWALASDTPFRRYKAWPYAGGTRDPLIISWPRAIHDHGAIRPQSVDVIDLAPTLADIAGTHFDPDYNMTPQIPVAGASAKETLFSAQAPSPRATQFFELNANRAIRYGDWKAVAMHKRGTDFEKDSWQLFNLKNDFSEAHDLAQSNPKKLQELQKLWAQEAGKFSHPALTERPEHAPLLSLYDEND